MSDVTYIGQRTRSFNSTAEFDGFSKVVITVTDELEYVAGENTGRTLTLSCPWGTQEMADSILADIRGYRYHPYAATGAYLDPAAEIGDGVTVNGIYSGIYTMDAVFGRSFLADISAPSDEEIDHEYPYIPQQERTIRRKFAQVESEFKVQQGMISAKVSKTGGDSESFGWELDETSWTLKSKNRTVLEAKEDGVVITGKLFAEEGGKIGGFDIMSNYLSYNSQTWEGENERGAYLGIQGFQMGNQFRVDIAGNLYAASGTFEGNVYAKNIQYGNEKTGSLPGGAITMNSIVAGQYGPLSKGVNDSLSYANYSNDVFNGSVRAGFVKAETLSGHVIKMGGKTDEGCTLGTTSISYTNGNGKVETLNVVTWTVG